MEPPMEKMVTLHVKPRIDGMDEAGALLDEAWEHLAKACELIKRAEDVTLTVTASAEVEETND